MTNVTVIEISGGIAEVTTGDDYVLIDWDNPMDFENAHRIISELMESQLDGPSMMAYVRQVAEAFSKYTEVEL